MKDNKSKEKIVIIVKGGVVQSLYVSGFDLEVDVFDLDNEVLSSDDEEEKELAKRCHGLTAIM